MATRPCEPSCCVRSHCPWGGPGHGEEATYPSRRRSPAGAGPGPGRHRRLPPVCGCSLKQLLPQPPFSSLHKLPARSLLPTTSMLTQGALPPCRLRKGVRGPVGCAGPPARTHHARLQAEPKERLLTHQDHMGRLPVATLIQTPLTSFSSKPPPRGTQRCIRAPSHDAGAGPTGGTGGRPCYCTQPALSWGTASTQHVARRCPETATQPPQPPATSALPCAPPTHTHTWLPAQLRTCLQDPRPETAVAGGPRKQALPRQGLGRAAHSLVPAGWRGASGRPDAAASP